MNHLPHLIHDLGLILILAGITTLLFKRLKQPVVLGYILAGLLVSPHFPFLPSITEIENIRIWADIGVIFLLFTLGLEFSFKKLMRVGGSASITAFIEISAMLGIGFLLGYLLGWPFMDCIFLGGILSIASTTIILRSFDELNVKGKRFADLVFGILIIEDLIAVVLLVLLSTIAISRQFAGTEMLISVLKLTFFLIVWFVAGIFFIPSFLSRVQKHLNNETILILSIGLCLLMVILAAEAGFSPALGAFMMGSILAETVQAERIEKIIQPVKDLFGAIFFVSVGMLIDPNVLINYALPILLITSVFLVAKTLHVTAGAVISGQPLKTSLFAGMSMAQIGEFSFIIATLGVTLGVTSDFLYPIAVAVSAITTFSTPYMIKLAGPLYNVIDRVMPNKWSKAINRYTSGAQSMKAASDWKTLFRVFLIHVIIFSLVIIGIILVFATYIQPWIQENLFPGKAGTAVSGVICFIILSPFLWALVMRKLRPEVTATLWGNRRYRGPLLFLRLVRVGLGIFYFSFFLVTVLPLPVAIGGVVVMIILCAAFAKNIHSFYIQVENRFFSNFNNREIQHAIDNRHELAPWDARITQCTLPVGSPVTGMTLEKMAVREKFGVNIAMIRRGDLYTIATPPRYEQVYPGDVLFVIGTEDQIEDFRNYIQPENGVESIEYPSDEIVLTKVVVKDTSFMLDKTIRESGVRERTRGLVVGIERKGTRILNPESDTVLYAGDKVWIVGDAVLLKEMF